MPKGDVVRSMEVYRTPSPTDRPTDRPPSDAGLTLSAGRETRLREMPVRRVQEESRQDERAEGVQGWRAKQLDQLMGIGGEDLRADETTVHTILMRLHGQGRKSTVLSAPGSGSRHERRSLHRLFLGVQRRT